MSSLGMGKDFNTIIARTFGVIGQTNKPERALEVALDHGIEGVDVFRAVFGAPFHADHIGCVAFCFPSYWHSTAAILPKIGR